MLRFAAFGLALTLAQPAASSPTEDWSARIATDGLASTLASLQALPSPSPDDLLALGAVNFLTGIEGALQQRWAVGATGELAPVPVLRVPLPPNPAPAPADPALVREVFSETLSSMDAATNAFDRIGDDADIGLVVRLDDLWFDIDGNGARGPGEDLMTLALAAFLNPWDMPETPGPVPVVRFDTADAAWLSAYAHLVSALAEAVLAYDPTDATARMMSAATDRRDRLGTLPTTMENLIGMDGAIDKAMIVIEALRQAPDPSRTTAARDHLLAMIRDNRTFWTRVAAETDNEAEWIPNGTQTGAFGITLAPETGETWLAVLTDLEAMLKGDRLVPHWALPPGSGIDIAKFLDDPASIDILAWIHGIDALPYARKGPVIDARSWRAFESIVAGNSLLYALWLN